MGKLHFRKLHKEWAVIERIFQALPTHIDTITVAFIYKIKMAPRLSPRSGCPSRPALPCLYTTMFALYSSHIGCPNKFEFYGWGCTKSK